MFDFKKCIGKYLVSVKDNNSGLHLLFSSSMESPIDTIKLIVPYQKDKVHEHSEGQVCDQCV